jgi:O-acetyl-ADP-ribose deacetylase
VIRITHADITTLVVDAIVNAANETLLGGGGVDGAIHRAAGPALAAYCRALGGCRTGEAKISPAFQLPSRWIIHTVGPVWREGMHDASMLLASCYRNSFELALQHGVRRIAFPSISTGAYAYPKADAARIALSVFRDYDSRFEKIIACCFSEADMRLYQRVLEEGDDGAALRPPNVSRSPDG